MIKSKPKKTNQELDPVPAILFAVGPVKKKSVLLPEIIEQLDSDCFLIVIVKSLIRILLGFFDRAVEFVAEGFPEKLT